MFEDIFKKTEIENKGGVIDVSISYREDYWEEIKQSPKKLGNILESAMGMMASSPNMFVHQECSAVVCTDFGFVDRPNNGRDLNFVFKVYDIANEEQEKEYVSKLSPEDRKWYESDKNDKRDSLI